MPHSPRLVTAGAILSAAIIAACANHQPAQTTTGSQPKVVSQNTVSQDTANKTTPQPDHISNDNFPSPAPQTVPPVGPRQPPPPPASAAPATPPTAAPAAGLHELFPFIRADLAAHLIELDGTVPINCHDPATPDVFLEATVCAPDTKEYESLVMTRAKPSHLHAALLAIGCKPGAPGSWKFEDKKLIPIPPRGDPLDITIAYRDSAGTTIECPITEWVKMADTGGAFAPKTPGPRWRFAGSVMATRQGQQVYDADGTGLLIGLTTFGSEVISWADTLSPESSVQDPDWIANPAKVPAFGTPVIVRIRPADSEP